MSDHEFSQTRINKKTGLTGRGKAAVVGAVLLAGIGVSEKASPSTEVTDNPFSWFAGPINKIGDRALHGSDPSVEQRIIENPQNIPEGHKITITVDSTGDGPIKISQEYGAKGHVEDLADELEHERVDGILPAGEYPVYDKFVNPQIAEKLKSDQ